MCSYMCTEGSPRRHIQTDRHTHPAALACATDTQVHSTVREPGALLANSRERAMDSPEEAISAVETADGGAVERSAEGVPLKGRQEWCRSE